jgi:hypothetical protein
MSMNPKSRPPIGRQKVTPPRRVKLPGPKEDLALPLDRDESPDAPAPQTDPVIEQAQRDIEAGLVDTDMRATPGLDAERRERLVPGPGGKPPASRSG